MTLPHLNLLLAIIGLVVVAYAVNTSVDQRLPTMTLNFSYGEVAGTKGTAPAHLRCGQGCVVDDVDFYTPILEHFLGKGYKMDHQEFNVALPVVDHRRKKTKMKQLKDFIPGIKTKLRNALVCPSIWRLQYKFRKQNSK